MRQKTLQLVMLSQLIATQVHTGQLLPVQTSEALKLGAQEARQPHQVSMPAAAADAPHR